MPEINTGDFIEELRFDILEKDMIKAKLVLSKIDAVDESIRKMALFELNRADDTFAIPLIVNLIAEHPNLARTYPQLKEILYAKALYHPDMLLAMLIREVKRENQVVLVKVAGDIGLDAAVAPLMGILNEDQDESETISIQRLRHGGRPGDSAIRSAGHAFLTNAHFLAQSVYPIRIPIFKSNNQL